MSTAAGGGIVVDGLTRDFTGRKGTRRALDQVSFEVAPGAVLGVLGPNGAGKTTCVRILTTLLLPTSGHATVAGVDVVRDPRRVQRLVGVSFGGDSGLYTRLSARDNLRYFGTMFGMSGRPLDTAAARLLDRVGLADRAADRVETYSRGMRQRLHIARALLHDPAVLLLDEPSSGLDPASERQLRHLVAELRDEGRAVLLTTHHLVEAEQLCQQVVILREGRVIRGTSVRTLREEAARTVGHRLEIESGVPLAAELLSAVPGILRHDVGEDGVLALSTTEPAAAASYLLEKLDGEVLSLTVNPPSLEDAYLAAVR